MDRYSILAPSSTPGPQPVPSPSEEPQSSKPSAASEPLRFPGNDGGQTLSEMAERDLNAALQLLAERAQYITGASGAAIALRDEGEMICRASSGPSAPEMGAHLQVDSGLSGESVRTKQILRCDDAETDARVNRESCHALGIASVMVMPLMREQEVMGVFELFSGRVSAFEERDIVALQRIAEMIQTAVDHAEATERAEKRIASAEMESAAEELAVEVEVEKAESASEAVSAEKISPPAKAIGETVDAVAVPSVPDRLNIHTCSKCGFPVSVGRTLCLDCEAKEGDAAGAAYAPQFGIGEVEEESWLRSHWYVMGILVVAAIVVGVLLRLR